MYRRRSYSLVVINCRKTETGDRIRSIPLVVFIKRIPRLILTAKELLRLFFREFPNVGKALGNGLAVALRILNAVRRLTPLECCRLQGFPDWWEDGVEGSDSARYKMWGNGIALPCAVDVLRRLAKELDEHEQTTL